MVIFNSRFNHATKTFANFIMTQVAIGKPIKAVLFDKDGTIFDSEKIYCESWVHSAKAFNVHFTAQMYDQFVGVRATECYQRAQAMFGDDFPMDEFIRHNRDYIDQQKRAGVPLKPGFKSFFDRLLLTNVPIALVTSSARDAAILSFSRTEYLNHFDAFITGDQVEHAKPAPDCYLLACEQLNVKPENCLVFEDSTAGVTAAVAAGCQTVAIPDYLPLPADLLNQCAYVFDSFEDAHFLLDNI